MKLLLRVVCAQWSFEGDVLLLYEVLITFRFCESSDSLALLKVTLPLLSNESRRHGLKMEREQPTMTLEHDYNNCCKRENNYEKTGRDHRDRNYKRDDDSWCIRRSQ